jgi:transcriptional regulator with XRE-family HTH domain
MGRDSEREGGTRPSVSDLRLTDMAAHVGARIRQCRRARGISPTLVAEHLGVGPHQLRKIERGENRISAAQLAAVADLLKVDISWFYAEETAARLPPGLPIHLDAETAALVRLFRRLPAKLRAIVLRLARELAALPPLDAVGNKASNLDKPVEK